MEQNNNIEQTINNEKTLPADKSVTTSNKQSEKDLILEFLDLIPADFKKDYNELFKLPDEKFSAAVKNIKEVLETVFKDPSYQETVLSTIRTSGGNKDFSADKEVLNEYIERVKASTLSQSKKDFIELFLTNVIMVTSELVEVPRQRIEVEIKKLSENAKLPEYAHLTDAGADIFALENTYIKPKETKLVKTGIAVAIPVGYEIQIRPRSGLSLKTGLRVANAPGTVDADYRGEVCVIMWNSGNEAVKIEAGDKIAQMVISEVPMIKWKEVTELSSTERGAGGFGSTGN
jgi:dUTP pyrophosphatase